MGLSRGQRAERIGDGCHVFGNGGRFHADDTKKGWGMSLIRVATPARYSNPAMTMFGDVQ